MLGTVAALLAGVAGFPLVILTVETLAGLRRPKAPALDGSTPRTTVIIPAHNEEGGIAATVAAIKPSGVDILVVADNCTDATAKRAREAGATAVERHDATARGKGYALAFGREALRRDPPDVVIILDADCVPDGDALFTHTAEGDDDMPAHVRTALTTVNLSIPIARGRMVQGIWQGIYLWEHRTQPHIREIVVHVIGE